MTKDLHEAIQGVASRVSDDMSERDVENAFLQEGFFEALDYEGAGYDLKSELSLPSGEQPDYFTVDESENVLSVFEFKNPREDPKDHVSQLWKYVTVLQPRYGVLTNGEEMVVYKNDYGERERDLPPITLESCSRETADELYSRLRKISLNFTDRTQVQELIDEIEPVSLDSELGREHFFNTFKLEENSVFAELVEATNDLLHELRDEQDRDFTQGAYRFWRQSYANIPSDENIPESWEPFLEDTDIEDFMFSLETGHAILARLMLAKACEDYGFFEDERMESYFRELRGHRGSINLDIYPVVVDSLMQDMEEELVESIFEHDIFSWWTDAYEESLATGHTSRQNRFRSVAKGETETKIVSEPIREQFGNTLARVFFSILKFDFSAVKGDPLGDLYQRYFDPETRKALGEFYTDPEIVEYIFDGMGYDVGISSKRLIDPACGSGTFLVEAVERYLKDIERFNDGPEEEPDWPHHLRNLCSRPRIVGLDIHPFAVLMAQVRFMVAILPAYQKAIEQDSSFTIHRLPIYRTDSLWKEREEADLTSDSVQVTLDVVTEENHDIHVPIPLPIEKEGSDLFHYEELRMPLFQAVQVNTDLSNFEEYFAALQGMMDVVKYYAFEMEQFEYSGGLREGISRYTDRDYDYEKMEEFFEPYMNDLLETIHTLVEEHDDGRLFKIFEDSVLSLVTKNYLKYDYVVGNPPWGGVLVGERGALADEEIRDIYREWYDTASGKYDIYVPFVEQGIDWLEPGGRIGYITQHRFMKRDYGEGLRELMLDETKIEKIIDFGDYDEMFEGATNYPCIFVLEKDGGTEEDFDFVTFSEEIQNQDVDEVMEALIELDEPWIQDYRINQTNLDSGTWSPVKAKVSYLVDAVEEGESIRLGSEYNTSQGCTIGGGSSWEDLDVSDIYIIDESKAREKNLESDVVKPVLKGKDIEKWSRPNQNKVLIYPYNEHGDPIDITSDDYSNLNNYLSDYKNKLESRELEDKVITDHGKEWFELWRPRDPEVLDSEKLITPRISAKNRFALDTEKYFLMDSGVGIECSEHRLFLLGFLNSTWTQFHVTIEGTYYQNRYWNYTQSVLESILIYPPEQAEGTEKYESIVDAVDTLLTVRETKTRLNEFPDSYIDDSVRVDWLEYEWGTKRYPVEAHIQERSDGTYIIEQGLADQITSPLISNPQRAEYVLKSVNGRRYKKGEEMELPIPRQESEVERLLEEREEDKQYLERNSGDELEEKIDEAVFSLLGLEEDDIHVIEHHLEQY